MLPLIEDHEDSLYNLGYLDGRSGELPTYAPHWTQSAIEEYRMGWLDGHGEYESASNTRPVDDDYYKLNSPPAGFEWVGEKRVAQNGEYYLTKNGNAKVQIGTRGNNQTRHILRKAT